MLWTLFFTAVVAIATGHADPHHHPAPPTKEKVDLTAVKAALSNLENFKQELFTNLTTLQTLLATAQERMNRIQFRDNGELQQRNAGQSQLIRTLQGQVKAAQHAADEADALGAAAGDLAAATADQMPDLTAGVDDAIADNNDQDSNVTGLQTRVDTLESDLPSEIDAAVNAAETVTNATANQISDLREIQDVRSCEYGTVVLDVPGSTSVSYTSNFVSNPEVTTSVVGFRVHIQEPYGHSHYGSYVDILGFDVTVMNTNSMGFDLSVTEVDDDAVHPKDVYVRYMACQNLNVGLEIP